MTEKAKAVGSVVHEISSFSEAVAYAVNIAQKSDFKTLACPGFAKKDLELLETACKASEIDILGPLLRDQQHNLHTALTMADFGIADTGTLVLLSDSEDTRIATMLSTIHIAVLPVTNIKPDSNAYEKELNNLLKKETPSYTAFITGPSRTADIERVLAIGVHGPVELHILLLTETSSHD